MAEVDKQTPVTVTFAGGINEAQQAELIEFGEFTRLKNVRQVKRGAVKKRPGFTSFNTVRTDGTTFRTAAERVIGYRDSHIVTDGDELDVYSPYLNCYASKRVPSVMATREPVASSGQKDINTGVYWSDMAVVGTYEVVIFIRNDSSTGPRYLYALVRDNVSKTVVVPPTYVDEIWGDGTASIICMPLIVAASSYVHVIYQDKTTRTDIYRKTLDLSTLSALATGWSASTKVNGAAIAGGNFDACSLGTTWAIAYGESANTIRVRTFTAAGVLSSSSAITVTNLSTNVVAIGGISSDTLWLAHGTTDCYVIALNPSTLATTGTETLVCSGASLFSNVGCIAIERDGAATATVAFSANGSTGHNTYVIRTRIVTGAVATLGNAWQPNWLHIAGRPFVVGSRTYLPMVFMVNQRNTLARSWFLCDVTSLDHYDCGRVVANVAPRLSLNYVNDYLMNTTDIVAVPHFVVRSANEYAVPIVVQENSQTASVQVVTLDFASTHRHESGTLGGTPYFNTGAPFAYDGAAPYELSFFHPPALDPPSAVGVGGITTTGTGYSYCCVWRWQDSDGNIHRSAPSNIQQTGAYAGIASFTITITSLYLTWKQASHSGGTATVNPVWCEIYRTTNAGVTYYLLDTVENRTLFSTLPYSDTITDATLQTSETLYSQPGEIGAAKPHVCPPSFVHTCVHGNRVWGVADDQKTLWFSAQRVQGEGIWFSDVFTVLVEQDGPTTAIASMDGRLVVFKERAIYIVDGDGPSENGVGEFGVPYKLPCDVGCVNARSVAVVPDGVFFESSRGVMVLTRGQSTVWVGEQVQDTLAAYPTITSATTKEQDGVVLITCSNGSTGVTLVFDYLNKVWSTDYVTNGASGAADCIAPSSCISGTGLYTRVHADGQVWSESTTSYRDGTYWVPMLAEFGWLKSSGLQGEQDIAKVSLLARSAEYHDLRIRVGYDYATDYIDDRTFSADELADMRTEQVEIVLSSHRSQSVRFEFSDEEPSAPYTATNGTGGSWIGVTCNVQGRPGGVRLPPRAR